ncbi:nitrate reductase molybdenum cofactor assembly chaperone [Rhodococcus sp. HM1]|uniref:nitrate reductase molybdenum cofactor assembly chaperone n=1 Tax=unclassified Rhodococcus (in: high G+C Gram-positive bacteria) TaxID=192944 RepID=UPI0018CC9CFC|nr:MULTISPECIES: nitrate reductase molybdenum cofactor assembly chaperone [unclassified Rhodococcus (in: high G+C Gram-positive bacteria)]MBH0118635.1 nitrate reductase molybdenum cofactor assembly chaperone [Rhodococcus sp. CX]MCK8675041.1 nitrate reductase molybdenum cofactor assembly chaperone [Rhodococcus sp. HM1]
MRLLSRARSAPAGPTLQDRLVWQAASLLLAYPDEALPQRLDTIEQLRAHVTGRAADLLGRTAAWLRESDPVDAATTYVDVFDLRRRSTMYLTYWTGGDTRNRGTEIHAFAQVYRAAGVEPPVGETPDHLPVVLEFAASVDPEAGRRLLVEHRVPIDVLREALTEAGSPYAHTVEAVCATLPPATDQELQRAARLAQAGPPAEAIGLQPFTLTVPPRRNEGEH